jgi:hypothetical protein
MAVRIMQVVFFAFIMAFAVFLAYSADERAADDGFISSTINAVFDKVNKYTSGEKSFFIKDYNKPDNVEKDYSTDALGRKVQEPVIRTSTKPLVAKDAKDSLQESKGSGGSVE